jgi:hypothetical protein
MNAPKLLASLILVVAGFYCNCIPGTKCAVMLRVVDGVTQRPLKGVSIGLSILDDKDKPTSVLNAKTNSDGVVLFHLEDPVPQRIGVVFAPDEFKSCSDVQFSVTQILSAGIVDKNMCGTEHFKYSGLARPGELVVFGKKVTLWQKLRREIP